MDDITLNYQIIADKKGHLDSLEILVEVAEDIPFDDTKATEKLTKEIQSELLNNLYINAIIKLLNLKA